MRIAWFLDRHNAVKIMSTDVRQVPKWLGFYQLVKSPTQALHRHWKQLPRHHNQV